MSNRQACCRNHANFQAAFPALPRYTTPSSIVHLPHNQESVAGTTRKVLAEWDGNFWRSRKSSCIFYLTGRSIPCLNRPGCCFIICQKMPAWQLRSWRNELIKCCQRSRTITVWHDNSITVLGCEYIFITAHVVYDPTVFVNETEYHTRTGKRVSNLQQQVEEPDLYLLAVSSSSGSGLILDCLDCLLELSEPLCTTQAFR